MVGLLQFSSLGLPVLWKQHERVLAPILDEYIRCLQCCVNNKLFIVHPCFHSFPSHKQYGAENTLKVLHLFEHNCHVETPAKKLREAYRKYKKPIHESIVDLLKQDLCVLTVLESVPRAAGMDHWWNEYGK